MPNGIAHPLPWIRLHAVGSRQSMYIGTTRVPSPSQHHSSVAGCSRLTAKYSQLPGAERCGLLSATGYLSDDAPRVLRWVGAWAAPTGDRPTAPDWLHLGSRFVVAVGVNQNPVTSALVSPVSWYIAGLDCNLAFSLTVVVYQVHLPTAILR